MTLDKLTAVYVSSVLDRVVSYRIAVLYNVNVVVACMYVCVLHVFWIVVQEREVLCSCAGQEI